MKTLYQKNFIRILFTCTIVLFFFSINLSLAQTPVPESATVFAPGPTAGIYYRDPVSGGRGTINPIINPETGVITPSTVSGDSFNPVGDAYNPNAVESEGSYDASGAGPITLFFYGIFVSIGGMFVWFGGLVLDHSIHQFLVLMGEKLNGNFGLGLNSIWETIRDLLNLVFIFALIWIGLKTILNSDDSAVKKQLGYLIIAALLINFSLLISKTIVDFANIAAYQIYSAITVTGAHGSTSPFGAIYGNITGDDVKVDRGHQVTSISGAFMQSFNLATYANPGDGESSLKTAITTNGGASGLRWKIITFGILMMFMMMFAGFVFLSGAYLILHRFVVLIIYMMLSPVMFLGWIYPGLNKHSKKWWDGFLASAFVAPAYLFLIYVALRMIQGMTDNGSNMNFGNAFQSSGTGDAFGVYVYFFVMCGFLMAATRVAGMMGAAGADMTAKIGNMGKNLVLGAATGAGGLVYRNTGGRLAGGAMSAFDRLGSSNKVGRIAQGLLGGEVTRRALESGRNYRAFGSRGRDQAQSDSESATRRNLENQGQRSTSRIIAAGATVGATDEQRIKASDAIAGLSQSELIAQLKKYSPESPEYKSIVSNMSASQFGKLMDAKPEEFDQQKKDKLGAARRTLVTTRITTPAPGTTGPLRLADAIKSSSLEDLAVLDFNELKTNAAYLQSAQLDKMKTDDHFKGPRLQILKDAHEAGLRSMSMAEIISSRKGDENISKLPASILTQTDSAGINTFVEELGGITNKLNNSLLTKIANRDDLDGSVKKQIGDAVRSFYTRSGRTMPPELSRFFRNGPGVQMS